MKVTVLLAHPRPASFNHAIAEVVNDELGKFGHDVRFHDLHHEEFDPLLKAEECYTTGVKVEDLLTRSRDPLVQQHRAEITEADGLIIVHPNWWGKPPAILSGWLDRVLVPGVAYRLADATGEPDGLLRLRSALVINTTDTLPKREAEVLGDPLEAIWTRCVLPYCGVERVERLVIGPVTDSLARQRKAWLAEIAAMTSTIFEN